MAMHVCVLGRYKDTEGVIIVVVCPSFLLLLLFVVVFHTLSQDDSLFMPVYITHHDTLLVGVSDEEITG